MYFQRFYDSRLAQASYLVGCQATGEAIVVDANRDASQYVEAAKGEGLRITHVTETHIHADFVSGSRELVHATGAALFLSGEGGDEWQYGFAASDGATILHDGDRIDVGNIRLDVLHVPGHTPEHLAFLVTDTPATGEPIGMLTGDFIFVGDVGRPDLLERAAKHAGTMEGAARSLFRSLARVRGLPDHLQIWPGHGAGSACGKALGAMPQSTLGYERIANGAMQHVDEDAFVRDILEGQPDPPSYFAEMKRINRDGPGILGGFPRPEPLSPAQVFAAINEGLFVVDTRPAEEFARAHVPGTINIPLNRSFSTWAGWLLPYDSDFALIVAGATEESAAEAARDLAMIGLDRVTGYAGPDVVQAWTGEGHAPGVAERGSTAEAQEMISSEEPFILDVRTDAEWAAGHIPAAHNIPLGQLPRRLGELPVDRPLLVHCQSAARSAIAASVLRRAGFTDVFDMRGGFAQWEKERRAVEREGVTPPASPPAASVSSA